MAWTYILRCSDSTYYTGSCRDLERRLLQHQTAATGYTSTRRPVQLVWSAGGMQIEDAHALERRIHGWSRAKKEALIRNDFDALPFSAKRRGGQ